MHTHLCISHTNNQPKREKGRDLIGGVRTHLRKPLMKEKFFEEKEGGVWLKGLQSNIQTIDKRKKEGGVWLRGIHIHMENQCLNKKRGLIKEIAHTHLDNW